MRKTVFFAICSALLVMLTVQMSSCSKRDITNPPGVYFEIEDGYVYSDTVLPRNSIASIWVYATKMGVNDLIESGTIQRSINGGPDTTLNNMKIVTSEFLQ